MYFKKWQFKENWYMFIVNYYIINPQTIQLMGEYDRYGKLCTRVVEVERSFLVDMSPTEVLKGSINYIGYDLKGAIAGSRNILGNRRMYPIMVNYISGICLFPDRSYKSTDCVWFNPYHIVKTSSFNKKTKVVFSNGSTCIVNTRFSAFNTKVQTAEQLRKITLERGKNPMMTFVLEAKKEHSKQQI
jgi:competence protein ComK